MVDASTAALDLDFADAAADSGPAAGPVPPQLPALAGLDWSQLAAQLDGAGFAVTPPLLSPEQCQQLIDVFDDDAAFRSTIMMARYSFGEGSYRYFADPLPPLVQALRTSLYPPLAAVANRWAGLLGEPTFPTEHGELVARCAEAGQHRPTPLVLRYGPGGYNCLHQDVYGELTFPLQVLFMLNTPDEDFTGGESVLVEQRPRQQSRPMVARPGLGQAVIFPVRNRPRLGARGYHRVQLRHGVSAVHSGDRHVLGVIFHNAR
ncbi:MAG: proline hydroxylase [Pseudonocardiaceae bacterium]|nr:proline hydroxylase [Pseudonocardiaceae bacterium]